MGLECRRLFWAVARKSYLWLSMAHGSVGLSAKSSSKCPKMLLRFLLPFLRGGPVTYYVVVGVGAPYVVWFVGTAVYLEPLGMRLESRVTFRSLESLRTGP